MLIRRGQSHDVAALASEDLFYHPRFLPYLAGVLGILVPAVIGIEETSFPLHTSIRNSAIAAGMRRGAGEAAASG